MISFQERGSSSPHPGLGDKEHGICGLVDGIGSVSAGDLSLAGKSYNLQHTTKSTCLWCKKKPYLLSFHHIFPVLCIVMFAP